MATPSTPDRRAVSFLASGEPESHGRKPRGSLQSRPESTTFASARVAPQPDSADSEEVRGDDPDLASYLRIEERELEAGGLN
jgi:hypothetical protein